jgi:hypothetical protein
MSCSIRNKHIVAPHWTPIFIFLALTSLSGAEPLPLVPEKAVASEEEPPPKPSPQVSPRSVAPVAPRAHTAPPPKKTPVVIQPLRDDRRTVNVDGKKVVVSKQQELEIEFYYWGALLGIAAAVGLVFWALIRARNAARRLRLSEKALMTAMEAALTAHQRNVVAKKEMTEVGNVAGPGLSAPAPSPKSSDFIGPGEGI